MARSKSQYICQRCECAVVWWRGSAWKHCAGRNQRSCKKPPVVVERAAHEAQMAETIGSLKSAIRDRLDLR